MMDCGDCFYSQLIDGTLFCNHYGEDVNLEYVKHLKGNYECLDYVNAKNVKNILKYYNNFLKEHLKEISYLDDCFDDFLFENKDLL